MDAHVYVFRRSVLDLMMSKDPRDLESIKENLVPWLVKGGWQDGVRAKWNQSAYRCMSSHAPYLSFIAVLNHTSDPLAASLAKSTVASLSLTNDPPADQLDYFESTNATSPSSPAKTPGETLVDFKYSLSGKVGKSTGDKRKSYQRPAPGDELRCAMVIYERPVPEVAPVVSTQNQKGRGQQVPEKEKDVEPPLMRGNTVAGYWELNRQVSTPPCVLEDCRTDHVPPRSSSVQCHPTLQTYQHDINLALRHRVHRRRRHRQASTLSLHRSEMWTRKRRYRLIRFSRRLPVLERGLVSRSASLEGIVFWARTSSLRIVWSGTTSLSPTGKFHIQSSERSLMLTTVT